MFIYVFVNNSWKNNLHICLTIIIMNWLLNRFTDHMIRGPKQPQGDTKQPQRGMKRPQRHRKWKQRHRLWRDEKWLLRDTEWTRGFFPVSVQGPTDQWSAHDCKTGFYFQSPVEPVSEASRDQYVFTTTDILAVNLLLVNALKIKYYIIK